MDHLQTHLNRVPQVEDKEHLPETTVCDFGLHICLFNEDHQADGLNVDSVLSLHELCNVLCHFGLH